MNEMAFRVTSNDGTTIASHTEGSGPAVVLQAGTRRRRRTPLGACSRRALHGLQLCLSGTRRERLHRALRRGKGDRGPGCVDRGGGRLGTPVRGVLCGALALEAAAAGSAIDTIAVWEVPYAVGDDIRPRFEEYIADTRRARRRARRGGLELFMRVTGASDDNIAARKAAGKQTRIGRIRSPSRPRWSTTASSSTATNCRPIDWQRSPNRSWSPPEDRSRSPIWQACPRTSSTAQPTSLQTYYPTLNGRPSRGRITSSTHRPSARCCYGSSAANTEGPARCCGKTD